MVRAIAVTIEPISRGHSRVEASRTSDVADRELRGRMGFIETARRKRQTEAVARREELADGHAAVRFAGYVTGIDELGTTAQSSTPPRCPGSSCSDSTDSKRRRLHAAGRRDCGERGSQPGHRATTAHIQAAYPFVAEGELGGRGVYLGRDVYGGSFCYDPWELYGEELTSPNAVVIGIVGRGKSSLVKTYVLRQAVFGRQAWIVDVKGEYDRLAEALCVRPIALSPGGPIRLNPLTPRGGPERQLNLLYSVAAAALGDPHARGEACGPGGDRRAGSSLRPGADAARRRRRARPPARGDGRGWRWTSSTSQTSCGRWRSRSTSSAPGTCAACSTDRPLPGSISTRRSSCSTSAAVLNTQTALGILMTCATAWLQAMIEAETDERSTKRIVVVDEGWRILSSLDGDGSSSRSSSPAPSAPRTSSSCTASPTCAPPVQETASIASPKGCSPTPRPRSCTRSPPDQLPHARELLGLTDTEAELLPHLRRGWALWKVGERSFLVEHHRSTVELDWSTQTPE